MRSSFEPLLQRLLRLASEAMLLYIIYRYLSDTFSLTFTVSGFLIAAAAGILLERRGLRPFWALAVLVAAAFIIRIFIFTGADIFAVAGDLPVADFRFFIFDSGFFPLLLPLLYIAMMNFLSGRKPSFKTAEVLLNGLIFALLMWKQGGYEITLFPHPGIFALFSFIFIILEILILVTGNSKVMLLFFMIIIPVLLLVLLLFFGRYTEGAAREGGGLMKPTLFRFDFSDFVKLESEISMSNDLVLLMKNKGYLNSVYLRRFYLSGYRKERGFFLENGPGETGQTTLVPDRPGETAADRYPNRIESEQEYFIKNFDPQALIAMNYPVSIIPLTNWSGSSFLRNYRVISESVELPSWELSDAPALSLEQDLRDFYTEYGDDQRIKELAEEVTAGLEGYYDKVIAIMFYLKDSYYYSLKPGVAGDGNQLHHFLFDSRKGYCSYFAFSMTLMCRSIGIPARVAAGFFIDPESGILNVYPVREDMAHAWVEVPFEGFGWVEFDPTSERIAPGEDFEFAPLDSSEYADLVEEVISSEYSIELKDAAPEGGTRNVSVMDIVKKAGEALRRFWFLIIPAVYILFLVVYHLRCHFGGVFSEGRARIRALYRRSLRMSSALGTGRKRSESIVEHALRADAGLFPGFSVLASCYLESVFAPDCPADLVQQAEAASAGLKRSYALLPRRRRFGLFIFPLTLSRRRVRGGRGAAVLLVMLVLLCGGYQAGAEDLDAEPGTESSWYLEAAGREEDSENYSGAIRLLNEGITLFPDNWELRKAAGDLYADRELYNLAVEKFDEALLLSKDNTGILYSKSVAEGLLNLDEDSIASLERLLELEPDNYNGIADLGWMYFKTYRLDEAEVLLLDAAEKFPDSPIFSMTLGTVYSGKYDYENSEKYYTEAITVALDKGWEYFASVSYYNLSLLEHGFYHYEKALEYTDRSIETGERAPGYIARAELYLGKLDFDSAFQNYQQAYILDSTPLALMGLADLYLNFGLLDEALAHIEEVRKRDDDSWMYYFGVDPGRHGMEVDRLLSKIYAGLARRELKKPVFGSRRASALAESIRYRCLEWYHNRRYRKASFDVGLSNLDQGNSLDAAWAFYIANEDYTRPAVKYLRRAESIEVEAAPEAEASYLLERGRAEGSIAMVEESLRGFDPEWERQPAAIALAELAVLYKKAGQADDSRQAAEELFTINPGIFIRNGLCLPLEIESGGGFFLKRALRRGGFDLLPNNAVNSYRYKLSVADNDEEVILYSVHDSKTGVEIASISVNGSLNSPQKASAFTAELKKRLFNITDDKDSTL